MISYRKEHRRDHHRPAPCGVAVFDEVHGQRRQRRDEGVNRDTRVYDTGNSQAKAKLNTVGIALIRVINDSLYLRSDFDVIIR